MQRKKASRDIQNIWIRTNLNYAYVGLGKINT